MRQDLVGIRMMKVETCGPQNVLHRIFDFGMVGFGTCGPQN